MKVRSLLGLPLLLAAFVAARPAVSDDAVQRLESEDHLVSIALPADWKATRGTPENEWTKLDVQAVAPKIGAALRVRVLYRPGLHVERAEAYVDRGRLPAEFRTKHEAEVRLDPVPHCVLDTVEGDASLRRVWIYRVIDRNGFAVAFQCPKAAWEAVGDACFKAAASLKSAIPQYAAPPAGYVRSEIDGYAYFVHSDVKPEQVEGVRKFVAAQEKRFAERFGPVPKPPEWRPEIVVSPDQAAAGLISKIAGLCDRGCYGDPLEGRFYAVPFDDRDAGQRGGFAMELTRVFFGWTFGVALPGWVARTEEWIAYDEACLGRPLPAVSARASSRTPKKVVRLDKVETAADWPEQSFAYVALFRAGPQPYRDAFAAYVKEYLLTGDWEAAETKHLRSLDQEKLRAAAQAFLKELKPSGK